MSTLVSSTAASRTNAFAASTRRPVAIMSASLVVAACARIAFPLPFTPVPFTLQPLAVLGVGLALGPLDAALALAVYLLEGACGLPVFSPTGPGGLTQLLGPTGGYLFAYPLVAFLTSLVVRKLQGWCAEFVAALAACTLAVLVLFTFGAAWLALSLHLGPHQVWRAAVLPFLPGEAIKVAAAAGTYRALQRRRPRA